MRPFALTKDHATEPALESIRYAYFILRELQSPLDFQKLLRPHRWNDIYIPESSLLRMWYRSSRSFSRNSEWAEKCVSYPSGWWCMCPLSWTTQRPVILFGISPKTPCRHMLVMGCFDSLQIGRIFQLHQDGEVERYWRQRGISLTVTLQGDGERARSCSEVSALRSWGLFGALLLQRMLRLQVESASLNIQPLRGVAIKYLKESLTLCWIGIWIHAEHGIRTTSDISSSFPTTMNISFTPAKTQSATWVMVVKTCSQLGFAEPLAMGILPWSKIPIHLLWNWCRAWL